MADSKSAKFIRGLVKLVFVACYVAFMWASIHHVAAFFQNFEQGSDELGSYLLAGAFDVTALVTTMGVMFFRKSMPRHIQVILWIFIICIAAYSFFINWEYSAHYQAATLTLQPTGGTIPVFDAKGGLHYVPEMRQNIILLWVNPLLASGFTIFSLIYSVVAEFFGTKPPTIEELTTRKQYLQETAEIQESIKQLEGKGKEKSFIQSAKEKALEFKGAVKEVTKKEEAPLIVTVNEQTMSEELTIETSQEYPQLSEPKTPSMERNTDELQAIAEQTMSEESATEMSEVCPQPGEEKDHSMPEQNVLWNGLSSRGGVSIEDAAKILNVQTKYVRTLLKENKLKLVGKSKDKVSMPSLKVYSEKQSKRLQLPVSDPINKETMSTEPATVAPINGEATAKETADITPINSEPMSTESTVPLPEKTESTDTEELQIPLESLDNIQSMLEEETPVAV